LRACVGPPLFHPEDPRQLYVRLERWRMEAVDAAAGVPPASAPPPLIYPCGQSDPGLAAEPPESYETDAPDDPAGRPPPRSPTGRSQP
jgi:hypothetical protein